MPGKLLPKQSSPIFTSDSSSDDEETTMELSDDALIEGNEDYIDSESEENDEDSIDADDNGVMPEEFPFLTEKLARMPEVGGASALESLDPAVARVLERRLRKLRIQQMMYQQESLKLSAEVVEFVINAVKASGKDENSAEAHLQSHAGASSQVSDAGTTHWHYSDSQVEQLMKQHEEMRKMWEQHKAEWEQQMAVREQQMAAMAAQVAQVQQKVQMFTQQREHQMEQHRLWKEQQMQFCQTFPGGPSNFAGGLGNNGYFGSGGSQQAWAGPSSMDDQADGGLGGSTAQGSWGFDKNDDRTSDNDY